MAKKISSNRKDLYLQIEVKQRRTLLDELISQKTIPIPEPVLEAIKIKGEIKSDIDAATELLDSQDEKVRVGAALCIFELTKLYNENTFLWYTRKPTTPKRLFEALNDNTLQVQLNILKTLERHHFVDANDAFPVLLKHLRHEDSAIQVSALAAIQSYGVDLGSRHVSEIAELVSSSISDVQIRACQVLASFEIDALEAVPILLKEMMKISDDCVREQLVIALAMIDPEGVRLITIKQDEVRDVLIDELKKQGEVGRPLRRKFSEHWRNNEELDQLKIPTYLGIHIDIESRIVTRESIKPGDEAYLPDTLFKIFKTLLKEAGNIVSNKNLINSWAGNDNSTNDGNLQSNIKNLRIAIATLGLKIINKPSHGYFLVDKNNSPLTQSPDDSCRIHNAPP